MLKTLLAVLFAFVMVPSAPFAASNSDQVEMKIDKTGVVTVPVTVNGQHDTRVTAARAMRS